MKRTFNPIMEVIRFTTEDVIVTSGGSTSGTADPVKFLFEAGTPYFARGDEINQGLNITKAKEGYYYYFTPSADVDTFSYIRSNYNTNEQSINSSYIYVWYKDSGWYSDGLKKEAYLIDALTEKYDFPTN